MDLLGRIGGYLLHQSWQVTVVFVIVAVGCFLLRRASAHWRYLLWLVVIVKCLVPPVFNVPLPIIPEKSIEVIQERQSIANEPEQIIALRSEPLISEIETINEPTTALVGGRKIVKREFSINSLSQWLLILWAAGSGLFVVFGLLKYLRFMVMMSDRSRPAGLKLQAELATLSEAIELPQPPQLRLIDGFSQPFVWGLCKGNLYLPSDFETTPYEHRKQIMMHELAHVKRCDPAINIIQILVQIAFFFHPLVWFANRQIRREREKCCDEIAIATLQAQPKEFGTAILEAIIKDQKSSREVPSLAVAGPVKNVEDRIKTIMRPDKRFCRRPSILSLITFILFLIVVCPMAVTLIARGQDGKPDTITTTNKTQDEITILVLIDGYSKLHVTSEGLYWENITGARPGLHGNQNQPTWVNGEEWIPIWPNDIVGASGKSKLFKYKIDSPTGYDFEYLHSAGFVHGKYVQNRTIVSKRVRRGELIFTINDGAAGPAWYCFKLTRKQKQLEKPVDKIKQPSSGLREYVINFQSPDSLDQFYTRVRKAWQINDGRLEGKGIGPGEKPFLTYKKWFKKIKKVEIVGKVHTQKANHYVLYRGERTVRHTRSATNFRVSVGKINMIFNWELRKENHFRNGEHVTSQSGHALSPDKDHLITIEQLGDTTVVSVDGKKVYSTLNPSLDGTVTVYPAHGSEISISQIKILGNAYSGVTIKGHSHLNTY